MIRRSQVILALVAVAGVTAAALSGDVESVAYGVGVSAFWIAGLVAGFRSIDKRIAD